MRPILSKLCFILGDLISKPMVQYDWVWLYPLYHKLMSIGIPSKCNGFCGVHECNENQRENPNRCKRLK